MGCLVGVVWLIMGVFMEVFFRWDGLDFVVWVYFEEIDVCVCIFLMFLLDVGVLCWFRLVGFGWWCL